MTWGEFKRAIDKQLTEGAGNDEVVASIDWNGLEDPVVAFEVRRRREVESFVRVT